MRAFPYMCKSKLSTYIRFCPKGFMAFFPFLTWIINVFFFFIFLFLLLSGDRRPAQRAGRQRLQTGLPRHGQGEGKGRDDHLLPHQRPRRQLTTSQALPSLTSAPVESQRSAAEPPWEETAAAACLQMHTRRVVR